MKALSASPVLWTLVLVAVPASVSAQVRVEDGGWWEAIEVDRDRSVRVRHVDRGFEHEAPATRVAALHDTRGRVDPGFAGAGGTYRDVRSVAYRDGGDRRWRARDLDCVPRWVRSGRIRDDCARAPVPRVREVRYATAWATVRWGSIRIRGRDRYLHRSSLGPRELEQMLGRRTMARLSDHAEYLGARARLRGRVVDLGRGGIAVQVRAGRIRVAELHDYDRDRWIDAVHVHDPWGHDARVRPGRPGRLAR